jgi:O-succinylbenzoic acid--CoA ligase
VKRLLDIADPLLMEGKAFTKRALLEYTANQAKDPGVPAWRREVFSFMALFLAPDGGVIQQKSSGSTGDPKSFTLSRGAMLESAKRTIRFFQLEKGDRALLSLPVQYIAGKMMVVRALLGGLDLILTEPSSRPLENISGGIDFAAMVPLQIEESLRYGDSLGVVGKLIIGGGELHPDTRDKLSSMVLPEVYETFGMTETYTHFALRRINGPAPQPSFHLLEGVRAGCDSRGCLQVEVSGVTTEPLVTNDLVEFNERGDGFSWQGRFDNLINSGGIKIIPELLEEQTREIIGHPCLVLSEPDRKLGQRLVLLVEFDAPDPPMKQWVKLLGNHLSTFEMPRRIVTVPALPRNPSMKPDRTSARKLLL